MDTSIKHFLKTDAARITPANLKDAVSAPGFSHPVALWHASVKSRAPRSVPPAPETPGTGATPDPEIGRRAQKGPRLRGPHRAPVSCQSARHS